MSNIHNLSPVVVRTNAVYSQPMIQPQLIHVIHQKDPNKELESLVQHLQLELEAYRNKCHHLESHVIKLQQENEDIKMLEQRIQELIQENQRLNTFIREKKLEEQKNASLEQELQMHIQHLAFYESEIKKLQEILMMKQREMEEFRSKYTQLEISYQQLVINDQENTRTI
jgi:chromosome segregation ATPase